MKSFLKFIILFSILITGLVAVGVLSANKMVPKYLKNFVNKNTSFQMDIESSELKIFKTTLKLDDIIIKNNPMFPVGQMVNIDELKIRPSLNWKFILNPSIENLKIHEVVLDIESLQWVQLENGQNNFGVFFQEINQAFAKKDLKKSPQSLPASQNTDNQTTTASGNLDSNKNTHHSPKFPFIKKFKIKLNTIYYTDYLTSSGKTKKFDLKYEREFYNIESLELLLEYIAQDLKNTVANVIIQEIMKDLLNSEKVKEALQKISSETSDISKESFEKIKNKLKDKLKNI